MYANSNSFAYEIIAFTELETSTLFWQLRKACNPDTREKVVYRHFFRTHHKNWCYILGNNAHTDHFGLADTMAVRVL